MARIWPWREETAAALWAEARGQLSAGRLVALPTETYYALAAHPHEEEALDRLFAVKGRAPDKPILLLVSGPDMLPQVAEEIPDVARLLMKRFWPGPLTLILPARPGLSRRLTGGTGTVGVRQPCHEVTCGLIGALGLPVTGTSANRAGRPPLTRAAAVAAEFGEEVALIVDAGPCPGGLPSTIVAVTGDPPRLVRSGATAIVDLQKIIPELQTEVSCHG